jgi:hypothetical protein
MQALQPRGKECQVFSSIRSALIVPKLQCRFEVWLAGSCRPAVGEPPACEAECGTLPKDPAPLLTAIAQPAVPMRLRTRPAI